jgi:hypothetical protein
LVKIIIADRDHHMKESGGGKSFLIARDREHCNALLLIFPAYSVQWLLK